MPQRGQEVQQTSAQVTQMTPQLQEIFKKSLKSSRWNAIDLGTSDQYTHDNMVARWVVEKNKWLQVSVLLLLDAGEGGEEAAHRREIRNMNARVFVGCAEIAPGRR